VTDFGATNPCTGCAGTGRRDYGTGPIKCGRCGGTGHVWANPHPHRRTGRRAPAANFTIEDFKSAVRKAGGSK
jgi:hypothetical protein